MSRKTIDYSQVDWKQFFSYSEESPSGLIRLNNKIAGYKEYQTYDGSPKAWRVGLNYKIYAVHRIIWCLFNGSVESNKDINHIDNNPFNNKINNLECVTIKENQRRKKLHLKGNVGRNNRSGITGVREEVKKFGTYCRHYATVSWVDSFGKSRSKAIPYNGNKELAWELAELVRDEAISLVNWYGEKYKDNI